MATVQTAKMLAIFVFCLLVQATIAQNPDVEWNEYPLTQIGTIDMTSTSTQTFDIPTNIPAGATEVLVYTYVLMGYSTNLFTQMKVYTETSITRQFVKYLPIRTWSQSAYSTVSENMWFPISTNNRRVFVMLSHPASVNVAGFVNIIGYR